MEPGKRGRGSLKPHLDFGLASGELIKPILQAWGAQSISDCVDKTSQLALDIRKLPPIAFDADFLVGPQRVQLSVIRPDEFLDQLGSHEVLLQRIDDKSFQDRPRHSP